MRTEAFDAAVVGAGTAGAGAAYQLARAGLRVALLDVRPFDAAGARWVNGVPAWQLQRAQLAPPVAPELRGIARPLLLPPAGPGRLAVGALPGVLKVDMRRLVERLQRLALEAGAVAFERAEVREVVLEGERPVAVRAVQRPGRGPERDLELRARLLVDASGLGGAVRTRVPALARHTPPPAPRDLCVAAQQVRQVVDRAGARAWLAGVGARDGEAVTYLGVAGGFSTLMVNLELDSGEVEILGGSLADGSAPPGGVLIRDFLGRNPWVGERVFGGQGRIPLRRPYDRFAAPGVALVGNAACQVFPAHGSGIGIGLVAGRILAEAAADRADPGGLEATWSYQAQVMREIGGLLASYDVFRRLSQRLSGRDVGRLVSTGLMSPASARAGLLQHMPSPSPLEALRIALGATRAPRIAGRLAPSLARMHAVRAVYGRYPQRPDMGRLARWSRVAARLHGMPPDVREA